MTTGHKLRMDQFINELNLPESRNTANGGNRPQSVLSFLPENEVPPEAGEIFVDPKELEKHF